MKRGIDISAWQGKCDFEKIKASGVEFAIIRAGFSVGTIDKRFKEYITACNKLGIPVGIYWFSYAYNTNLAVKEAKAALKAVAPYKLDYPIFWDFEYDSINYAAKKGVVVTKKLASDMARAFMCTIKAAGYKTGNYTNLDFSKRYFDKDVRDNYDLWAARYVKTPVDIVNGAALWQYSSKGKVPGIGSTYVDLDYALKDYANNTPSEPAVIEDVPIKPAEDSYKVPSLYTHVFDADYYVSHYEDLADALKAVVKAKVVKNTKKDKDWWLLQHFLLYGMSEGRQACEAFNVQDYKQAYMDLRDAFGDDYVPYYYHYIQFGINEIREGKRKPF